MIEQSSDADTMNTDIAQDNPMSIDKAKELYAKYGEAFRAEDRAVIDIISEDAAAKPLRNADFLHALSLTELMLERTRQSFSMLTGGHAEGFLECLAAPFQSMLERIHRAGGEAKVIVVDGDARSLRQLAQESDETLKVCEGILVDNAKIGHFIVCDNDMVRDEEPHEELEGHKSASLVRAEVFFNNRAKAKALAGRFAKVWQKLT